MLACEGLGQAPSLGDENCGCLMCKFLKISNQVRLIVVAAVYRQSSPPCRILRNRPEHLLKPKNAAEQLRSNADFFEEASL